MRQETPDVDLKVAREILRYFERNPQAADTIEGVARWRLLEERIRYGLDTVSRAMAWLVSEGWLVKESTSVSGPVFRLNTGQRGSKQLPPRERRPGQRK